MACGGKAPPLEWGTGRQSPQLGITHFVTGSVMFFVVFPAFRHLFTPPKTPSLPKGPASLFRGFKGFSPTSLILEHKIRCSLVISMVFMGKVDAPVFLTFTCSFFSPYNAIIIISKPVGFRF